MKIQRLQKCFTVSYLDKPVATIRTQCTQACSNSSFSLLSHPSWAPWPLGSLSQVVLKLSTGAFSSCINRTFPQQEPVPGQNINYRPVWSRCILDIVGVFYIYIYIFIYIYVQVGKYYVHIYTHIYMHKHTHIPMKQLDLDKSPSLVKLILCYIFQIVSPAIAGIIPNPLH